VFAIERLDLPLSFPQPLRIDQLHSHIQTMRKLVRWGRRIVSKKLCSFQRAPEVGRDGSLETGYDLARLVCAARSDDQGCNRRMSGDELRGG
jgi:hypothetical protein